MCVHIYVYGIWLFSKNPIKMPLSKFHKNNIFYVFISNPRLLEFFVNFDQIWPRVDF